MTKHSGLADSPFFTKVPVYSATSPSAEPDVQKAPAQIGEVQASPKLQTSRLPDKQTSRVTKSESPKLLELQTSRVPDFDRYDVPDFRKMQRVEVRLTWEQNKYLDDLEALIGRDAPDGDKSDPSYRRITKNSVIRVMVEILRVLAVEIDASQFKNERDLLKALHDALQQRLSKLQTSRLPE